MRLAPIRLVIELNPGVDPITGVLQPPTGRPQPFTGWLELTQLLEAIRTSSGPRMHTSPPPVMSVCPPRAGGC